MSLQRQIAVTAYLKSRKLLLFVIAEHHVRRWRGHLRAKGTEMVYIYFQGANDKLEVYFRVRRGPRFSVKLTKD